MLSRRAPRHAVGVLAAGLVGGLVSAVLPVLGADAASATASARTTTPMRAGVPALMSAGGIRAQLPGGGTVRYRLPPLPTGGVRVLGDWDHDSVETPGMFADGQWQLWNQVQRPGPPAVTAMFGQPGDLPVTGDWNGDGVTDLGVVRGAQWLLALGPVLSDGAVLPVWRTLTFGTGTGTPVVGDWNGDGTDGIGTFSDGIWRLTDSTAQPGATFRAAYGTAGDRPVVGDWDGDGRDGLGVVRGGTWYLSNSVTSPVSASHRTFAPGAGGTPMSWQVPVAPGSATCPTAGNHRSGNPARVVPSSLLDRDVHRGVGRTGRRVRASLETAERYLLGTQYDAIWRATRGRAYLDLLDHGRSDELAVRLPAMSALTVAVGLRTGAFDREVVGVRRAFAARYVQQLVRSIACAHTSVSPGGWGRGWQSAHWAMLTGEAAWLLWDHLSAQTRRDVTSMVVNEANRLLPQAVPYWARPDGTVVTPGDSKAEENAWNSALLAFAAAMMPSAPRASHWRGKSAELAAAAYSTRGDNTSGRLVNGVTLADRLEGYNAYRNGTVENHHRIHPDYASNIQLLWGSADVDRLARQKVPEAMFHHAGLVYSAFSTLAYRAGATSPAGGTFLTPGGTVYRTGHSWIYYPQGDDWGTARRAHFVSLDAHAMVYAPYLRAHGWSAARALAWHETGQRALVASSGTHDGRTYSVDPAVAARQDTYPGREEYAAQNLATAWLALYVGQIGLPALDRGALPVPVATQRASQPPASALRSP